MSTGRAPTNLLDPSVCILTVMPLIPDAGRVHPLVSSNVARRDDTFIEDNLSAHFRMSPKTVHVMGVSIALLFALLVLLG